MVFLPRQLAADPLVSITCYLGFFFSSISILVFLLNGNYFQNPRPIPSSRVVIRQLTEAHTAGPHCLVQHSTQKKWFPPTKSLCWSLHILSITYVRKNHSNHKGQYNDSLIIYFKRAFIRSYPSPVPKVDFNLLHNFTSSQSCLHHLIF